MLTRSHREQRGHSRETRFQETLLAAPTPAGRDSWISMITAESNARQPRRLSPLPQQFWMLGAF